MKKKIIILTVIAFILALALSLFLIFKNKKEKIIYTDALIDENIIVENELSIMNLVKKKLNFRIKI